jgi:hypothetical protein
MAALQCLLEKQDASISTICLPPNLQESLQNHLDGLDVSEKPSVSAMLTALSFGNACGSASCLEEENSTLSPEEVLKLLAKTKPAFVSNHALPNLESTKV